MLLVNFICLYGLENLLHAMPDDLEGFSFKNTSKDGNVNLKIPKLLGKFTNLNILELENCISELPDDICKLENLSMIGLLNNKNLKNFTRMYQQSTEC